MFYTALCIYVCSNYAFIMHNMITSIHLHLHAHIYIFKHVEIKFERYILIDPLINFLIHRSSNSPVILFLFRHCLTMLMKIVNFWRICQVCLENWNHPPHHIITKHTHSQKLLTQAYTYAHVHTSYTYDASNHLPGSFSRYDTCLYIRQTQT